MLCLGPALVALSLPSRTAHIKMQEAFSPLALLGDAYDGALNSLIGPLGLEEAIQEKLLYMKMSSRRSCTIPTYLLRYYLVPNL